ncbi:hypothetical protein ACNOYE_32075 [Nannocystaceae bacterium ST9]
MGENQVSKRVTMGLIGSWIVWHASGCVIGYDPLGDEGFADESNPPADETDFGDVEGGESTDTGVEQACSFAGEMGEFDPALAFTGQLAEAEVDLDLVCTIVAPQAGAPRIDCGASGSLVFDVELDPTSDLPFEVGGTVHLRLVRVDLEGSHTWLRIDFDGQGTSLHLVDAFELEPPAPAWLPAPWSLSVEPFCSPFNQPCGVKQFEMVVAERDGVVVEATPESDPAGGAFYSASPDLDLELWVSQSHAFYDIDEQGCDLSLAARRLLVVSRDHLVEGDVCEQGGELACGSDLECCYPCGVQGCDFVCAPELPSGECPAPPP